MAAIKKEEKKGYQDTVIVGRIESHANDPFFVEKAEKAKEAIKKITFPEQLKK
ncbi:hypothetical protein KHS38_20740 [Mucilaginibacter sp. Bleaf8]|uniref:hypothetical protein n=1 Tax=Mucilaginibacter sp. Bleaf8 TaxID=2834430 RepID=UPI001BD19F60|nr:hypothetical protein [Mucilaginibacter sp. Bleaf8]MBS7566845.1 hypothetical protein [Mucilaginibacter sp. Bleaf8]